VVIEFAIFGYAEVWGVDWKPYSSTDLFLAYYDAQGITRPSKNVVRVWEKRIHTEKGVINWMGTYGKKYANLSYSIGLLEINCIEKKVHVLSLTHYENSSKVIDSYSYSSSGEWEFIVPESIAEGLYKEVCK
jgi:hypothetical protein